MKRSPIRKVNQKRRAAAYAKNFDGGIGHDHWIRALPCYICTAAGWKQTTATQAAHAKSRGAGGDWRKLVPLCDAHHRMQEGHPLLYKEVLLELAAVHVVQHEAELLEKP